MITALIVDDTPVMRESLPLLMPAISFAGSYAHVEGLLADARAADVVILDLHLASAAQPAMRQGVAAIRALVRVGYRVCAYTQEERRFVLAACLAAGASGVVSKTAGITEAAAAFEQVAAGEVVIPLPLVGLVEVLVRRGSVTLLSPRQREVLSGRARGLTYAELGRRMYLSEATLRGYWADVCAAVSAYFQQVSPADLEHALGLGPGDLVSYWPAGDDCPGVPGTGRTRP